MELWPQSTTEEIIIIWLFIIAELFIFMWGVFETSRNLEKKQLTFSAVVFWIAIIASVIMNYVTEFSGIVFYLVCSPGVLVCLILQSIIRSNWKPSNQS